MQFHLNGFRTGDPEIVEQGERRGTISNEIPPEVDVLIVGCGPAGLTLAAQLAAFPDIKTVIVDQKTGPLSLGQADGIACRTMEMFEAFGFSGRVLKEAYWVNETSFWKPDDNQRERIVRSGRIQDVEDGLSEFPHVILNQARVHDFYLDAMHNTPTRLEPFYARKLLELESGDGPSPAQGEGDRPKRHPSHRVTAKLERLEPLHIGEIETVQVRYVVGCDGARSTVRKWLGSALHGDSANQAWGVMDVLAITDFPDIRSKTAIHSANEGNMLIIPREGGYLVRLYIELDKLNKNERVTERNITIERLVAAAQRTLHPYTLEVKEVAWWSIYEIGQRLCHKFDDVPEKERAERLPCVFIAGDACHTHSPKAGQGMNVSMQDTFNLGWKLATVLIGRCSPQILHTYSDERQAVAKELIELDREFAKMFGAPPKDADNGGDEGINPAEFQRYFVQQGRFTAGTATRYKPSLITAEPTWQHLAQGLVIGMRFHSTPVIRLADAKLVHLGHTVKADGRWRLFLFANSDTHGASSSVRALCAFLAESPQSPVPKYTSKGNDIDSVIDVRAIFQQSHREIAIGDMPALLRPRKGRYGLCDYEKVFCPDLKGGNDVFDIRGIDRHRGLHRRRTSRSVHCAYPFYVSSALLRGKKAQVGSVTRVSATAIEQAILRALREHVDLEDSAGLLPHELIGRHVGRVAVETKRVVLTPKALEEDAESSITIPWTVETKRNPAIIDESSAGRTMRSSNPELTHAIVRAHAWLTALEDGTYDSVEALARSVDLHPKVVRNRIRLAFLAPALMREFLNGSRPATANLNEVCLSMKPSWSKQRDQLLAAPRWQAE